MLPTIIILFSDSYPFILGRLCSPDHDFFTTNSQGLDISFNFLN